LIQISIHRQTTAIQRLVREFAPNHESGGIAAARSPCCARNGKVFRAIIHPHEAQLAQPVDRSRIRFRPDSRYKNF
jgi:hypothetical protein